MCILFRLYSHILDGCRSFEHETTRDRPTPASDRVAAQHVTEYLGNVYSIEKIKEKVYATLYRRYIYTNIYRWPPTGHHIINVVIDII